ncbi:MAG TPA: SCO family protein [Bryobacteraceae bacterium]|nr:SCO family protein [Bryobacteraceae bacterium]
MHHPSRRNLLSLLGMAPVAGAALSANAAGATQSFAPETQADARERVRQRYFPDVPLRTQDNKKVHFYEDLIKNKIVTINFFYAKCEGVCPGISANLVRVQKLLGDRVGREIFMYSISLKPEEDTPAVLKEYAQSYHVRPGWKFLTGDPADIELLRRSLGFTNPDPKLDKDKSQHTGNIRYGNEPLMLWAACPGLAHAEWIAESIGWVDRSRVQNPVARP